jgi:hypothetical protein
MDSDQHLAFSWPQLAKKLLSLSIAVPYPVENPHWTTSPHHLQKIHASAKL